jgi:uncharacterized protein (DUF2132 family)
MRRTASSTWSFLGHPLFLLLTGTILGSILIPALSTRFNAERLLNETRHQEALSTIEKGFEVDRKLNSVSTRLASFAKDHQRLHQPIVFNEAILTKVEDLYVEFDQRAWWWSAEEFAKAKVLRLLSESQLKRFSSLAERYHDNLLASTAALDRLRVACLGASSDTAAAEREANSSVQELGQLALQRDQIVNSMADLFAAQ